MKKLLVMTLLMMLSLVGNAQVAVIINDNSGGEVKVTKTEGQVVTITVTPSAGYYIAKGDIVVIPVRDPSATRSEGDAAPEEEKTRPTGEPLTLEGDDPDDLTQERDYAFTVPVGLGALVEAEFHEVATEGSLGNVSWNVKTVTDEKTGTAEVVLTLDVQDGQEVVETGEGTAVPWVIQQAEITTVIIGAGITGLSDGLLNGCKTLKRMEILNEDAIISLGENALPENEDLTVDVPGNLYNEYVRDWTGINITSDTGIEMKGVEFGDNNSYDTFVSEDAVRIPSLLNALVITAIKGNVVIVEDITDGIIPAGVPVLLLSKEMKSNKVLTAASKEKGTEVKSLLQVAGDEGQWVDLGKAYLLYNDVFYLSQAGTVPAGGIYLPVPEEKEEQSKEEDKKDAVKARLYLNFDDDATGIKSIYDSQIYDLRFGAGAWYDLSGRRLNGAPTTKGVYINNGKKLIIR